MVSKDHTTQGAGLLCLAWIARSRNGVCQPLRIQDHWQEFFNLNNHSYWLAYPVFYYAQSGFWAGQSKPVPWVSFDQRTSLPKIFREGRGNHTRLNLPETLRNFHVTRYRSESLEVLAVSDLDFFIRFVGEILSLGRHCPNVGPPTPEMGASKWEARPELKYWQWESIAEWEEPYPLEEEQWPDIIVYVAYNK